MDNEVKKCGRRDSVSMPNVNIPIFKNMTKPENLKSSIMKLKKTGWNAMPTKMCAGHSLGRERERGEAINCSDIKIKKGNQTSDPHA